MDRPGQRFGPGSKERALPEEHAWLHEFMQIK